MYKILIQRIKFSLGDLRIQIYNYERKADQNGNRIAVWDDNVPF